MAEESLQLNFPDSSTAEGNRLASSLAETLRDISPSISVQRVRENSATQDFGASLAVMLGTAAATAVAKGIAAWAARNSGAKIEIRRNGELILIASHLNSGDVPKIVKAISSKE
jgi:hypothetical protein